MTLFVLSLITLIGIVLVARYYGSSELATNLLLTFAFSVFVGLGIKYYTSNSININNDVLTENVNMIDSIPMQMVLPVLETVNTQSFAGKVTNQLIDTTFILSNPLKYNSFVRLFRSPILFDSS